MACKIYKCRNRYVQYNTWITCLVMYTNFGHHFSQPLNYWPFEWSSYLERKKHCKKHYTSNFGCIFVSNLHFTNRAINWDSANSSIHAILSTYTYSSVEKAGEQKSAIIQLSYFNTRVTQPDYWSNIFFKNIHKYFWS